ncbi:MAG TPA: patatin-like phospholipase family protein [Sporolactobacillaceae bacterium]|nr:patatin-like phospholipase family protein [Sporolactobacillaceae bacterium]
MEWPLPLWLVLREELAELRPPVAMRVETFAAVQQSVSPAGLDESAKYLFSARDVLDLDRLKIKMAERAPELAKLLTPAKPAATEFKTFATAPQIVREEVRAENIYDTETLNRLLVTPDLYQAFPDLAESQWIAKQNPATLPEPKLVELNRYLLDRALAGAVYPADDKILPEVVNELHRANLSALCFSGGGIRSATFCLGVVQSLARAGLLDKFDYLSTVSGGGYLGGWLAAWTHWNKDGLAGVVSELNAAKETKLEPEPDPVFYLRNFSNYLTPQTGLFSADSWTLGAIYLRNLLLNWTVLLPILMAIVAVPYILLAAIRLPWIAIPIQNPRRIAKFVCFGLAVLSLAMAAFYEGVARPSRSDRLEKCARSWLHRRGQDSVTVYFLVPLMLSGFLLAEYLWHVHLSGIGAARSSRDLIAYVGAAAILGWIAYSILLRKLFLWDLFAMVFSSVLGGFLLYIVMLHAPLATIFENSPKAFICFGPPTILIVVLIASTIFTGLATFWTDDEDREYWARMGAWVLIAILGWASLGAIALFGPVVLVSGGIWQKLWTFAAALATAITTIGGWSGLTVARPEEKSPSTTSALITRGLPIVGVLAIALILGALALAAIDASAWATVLLFHTHPDLHAMIVRDQFSGWAVLAAAAALAVIGFLMSAFIDINKYSLHAMYRNRLIRAYLGASRAKGERKPNPFTGFDPNDNIPMSFLWSKKPSSPRKLMPFVNITLNLVEPISNRLAWQERKAESFTVTPLHSGSLRLGYRRSDKYASVKMPPFIPASRGTDDTGITLGTATAISGAAVSPNMGYNSSPIVEIILSILNLRLGWWLGNPGPAGNRTYMRAQPATAVKYFADEAFGRTSDEEPYVYLSDGGHFENLGLYEMVLRRCHTIVVIDADADGGYTYDNLGGAIRKIRIDLGIQIDFPVFPTLTKMAESGQTSYCAVGKIRYDTEDANAPDGNLIYIKPTLRGDESADVISYERQHPDFPHESTGDQWFTESQFESYRKLGAVELEKIIGGSIADDPRSAAFAEAARILRKLKEAQTTT